MLCNKTKSFLSKKTVATLFLLLCCVGSLRSVIHDGDYPEELTQRKGKDYGCSDFYQKKAPISDGPFPEHLLTEEENIKDKTGNDNDPVVIQFGMKDGKMWSKNNQNFENHFALNANIFYVYKYDIKKNPNQRMRFYGGNCHGDNSVYLLAIGKNCLFPKEAEWSEIAIPKKWLPDGVTVFLSKSDEDQVTIKKGVNPSDLINVRLFLEQEKSILHIKKDDNDSIWIESNQALNSENIDGKRLSFVPNQKQFFNNQDILINELGILQKDGSFKLDPKISTTQFSAKDIKKGITFIQKNGQLEWRSGLIPFSELEDPEEIAEEDDSTEEVMNNFYNPDQPAQLMDYASAAESTPETESSYFSALSNNKATVVCATTGLAIAAVLAHVLSGHNYLAKTDSWSLWSPSGLNSLALRSLPQNVLLEKLHQEIAFRYGNGPDRIAQFLKDIKEEIHQLNLCNWSYNSLSSLYLLPKIQSFENISQRIHLLEMFIYTIEQEMADKAITSLR